MKEAILESLLYITVLLAMICLPLFPIPLLYMDWYEDREERKTGGK